MSKQKNITTSELQTETTIPLEPEVGKHIFDCAFSTPTPATNFGLFETVSKNTA